MNKKIPIITIIGLGYVGLPLLVAFSKYFNVIGFDKNRRRINELKKGLDRNNEISKRKILSKKTHLTSNINDLKKTNVYIICVPTPVDKNKKPNLDQLKAACALVGRVISYGNVVVIESTVFPGTTQDICIPIIEKISKLKINNDFFAGYSPERINPGDKKYKLENINKIVSGTNKKGLNIINKIYKKIIKAKIFKADKIIIAEAAKIIENCQRDINIAFVNELSIMFDSMNINTFDVLKAANTKWNFLNFTPGLVGGHCIGVDPYYLMFKSLKAGYNSKFIKTGRLLNENMGKFVTQKLIRNLKKNNFNIYNSKILIMGFAFKENCKDIRNSGVIDIYKLLKEKKCLVDIFDPIIDSNDLYETYKIKNIKKPKINKYNSIIIAVPHKIFIKMGLKKIKKFGKKKSIIFDLKGKFKSNLVDITL